MHFGENQLSPLSIGISPLPTRHPSGLQSTPVRASTRCYARFTLHMGSSSGFGSTGRDHRAVHTCVRSGSGCLCLNPPRPVTRRIILQKARRQAGLRPGPPTARKHTVSGSVSLPSPGFFSPFPHGTVRYRSLRVVSLGQWAAQLQTGLLVSGPTQELVPGGVWCPEPGFHGLWRRLPSALRYPTTGPGGGLPPTLDPPPTPRAQRQQPWHANGLGLPRFARHYYGDPFSSSGYMRCFSSPGSLPHCGSPPKGGGVAPFGDRGIIGCARLPHAYRSGATSFVGTQRRGIHRVLIVSSLQVPLSRVPQVVGRQRRLRDLPP